MKNTYVAFALGFLLLSLGCSNDAKEREQPGGELPPAASAAMASAEHLARADERLLRDLSVSADGFVRRDDGLVSGGWRVPRLDAFYSVGARLDLRSAKAPLEVSLGKSERYRLRLAPQEVNAVPGVESGGRVVYPNAYPDADLLYAAGVTRTEALILIKSPRAPNRYRFHVELGPGFSKLHKTTQGEVEVLDAGGTARLIIERPYALDAEGTRRDAELSLGEREIGVRIDTTGLKFPVLLDPVIKPAIWRKLKPPGLTQRWGAALAYDPVHHETLLFGGNDGDGQSDTWSWNGTSWTLRSVVGPAPRVGAALGWDASRNLMLLFGGYQGTISSTMAETWEWDGISWRLAAPGGAAPPMLWEPKLVPFRGKLLLVGFNTAGSLNTGPRAAETWELDAGTWINKSPATIPQATFITSANTVIGTALVVDPIRDVAALITSRGFWEWNGSDWTSITPATRPDPNIYQYTGGFVGGKAIFVVGGGTEETWHWNGTNFIRLTPSVSPPGWATSAAVDTTRDRLLVANGATGNGQLFSSETWEFDGTTWAQKAPDQAPGFRASPALVYDPVREHVLIFGGALPGPGVNSTATNELWSYDGTGFKLENEQPTMACGGHVAIWSELKGGMVVANCIAGSTQLWDGTQWSTSGTGTGGIALAPPRMAEDVERGVIVAVTTDNPRQTWELSGSTWSQVFPPTPIDILPANTAPHGLIGASPGVFMFDNSARTWGYDGNDWLRLQPGTSPPGLVINLPANYPSLLWNPVRARPLLIPAAAANRGTVWEWDSQNWLPIPADGTPPASPQGGAAYDARRGTLVYFGGFGPGMQYGVAGASFFYELQLRGGPCDADSDCDTGECVDGVCCESASCPFCQACNVATQAGVCAPAVDLPDPVDCPAPSTCGANGTCGKAKGTACGANSECSSGQCYDGVCCDRDCSAGCNRCDLPGKVGTCTPVASGDPGSNPSCSPYLCKGQDTCPVTCAANTDCTGGTAGAGKCVSGACITMKGPGETCSTAAECGTNFCADGVCCNAACTNLCQGCRTVRTGLTEGTCGPIADGTQCGSATCTNGLAQGQICLAGNCQNGNQLCAPFLCSGSTCSNTCATSANCVAGSNCVDGTCTGATPNGLPCLRGSECQTGRCVDRVCCATACDGDCQACSSDRKKDGSASGTCGMALPATPCGATTCAPVADVVNGQLCSVQGTCIGSSAWCVPYHCDAQSIACRTACITNADCQMGFECVAGQCRGIQPNGGTCQYAAQCASTKCVDGVCCENACDGACESCALPFELGLCKAVAEDDPGSPSCAPYKCDGTSGDCPATCAGDADCTDTPCVSGACMKKPDGSSCTANAECVTGICAVNTCGQQPRGATCTVNEQCTTGYCVDGVCCEGPCTGCQACSTDAKGRGLDGYCENVANGRDPHDRCEPDDSNICGEDGRCDGEGACSLRSRGTACGAIGTSRCDGDLVIGEVCDGIGACISTPATGISCANQGAHCINGRCANPCLEYPGEACVFGTICNETTGLCDPAIDPGGACTADAQCRNSTSCVDGYCCDDICQGSCEACDVPDKLGLCSPVPEGGSPHGERIPCAGDHPICAGSCNGARECAYPNGECESVCANGAVSYSNCNGAGFCEKVPAVARACSPYACNAAGDACRPDCVSDADCAPGFECGSSQGATSDDDAGGLTGCVPKPNGRCLDDKTLEDTSSGRRINCVAYKCITDRCKESCATAADCQTGFLCDSEGRCVLEAVALGETGGGAAAKADDGGCGCRVAGQSDSPRAAWLALLGVLALQRRRRPRRATSYAR